MGSSKRLLVLVLAISSSSLMSIAQSTLSSCASYKFSNGKQFSSCDKLPYFNASLYWNYDSSSSPNGTTVFVEIAYKRSAVTDRRWIAWAINPTALRMVGSQALVAFTRTDGCVHAYTSPVRSYRTRLEQGNLSFPVLGVSAMYENNEMIIFATLQLPRHCNSTSHVVNHLWQEGPLNGDTPGMHSLSPSNPSLKALGTLDFLSAKAIATPSRGASTKATITNAHSLLSIMSWNLIMPLGAIVARYSKSTDPCWFDEHLTYQLGGYTIGMGGFFTGVYKGLRYGVSPSASARVHMGIGIALWYLASAQVLVGLFARPEKESRWRNCFNWFHYLTGHTTVLLSLVNLILGSLMTEDIGIQVGIGMSVVFLLTVFLACKYPDLKM